jgi:hypothetical protein
MRVGHRQRGIRGGGRDGERERGSNREGGERGRARKTGGPGAAPQVEAGDSQTDFRQQRSLSAD